MTDMNASPAPPGRITPREGQESAWDYPRPPRVEPSSRHVRVAVRGRVIAETRSAVRILETSHPPAWYLPPGDVRLDLLEPAVGTTACEWKGAATYFDVRIGDLVVERAAWTYRAPLPGYEAIRNYIAFYASRTDATVDGESVRPQAGGFYGGWVTDDVVGPFKGEPGTSGW
jgi:uncharacterized protein (DUF427 family)